MIVTATFTPPKFSFIPEAPGAVKIAYQCEGQSMLRAEIFLIYYYFFRHKDKHPTPDIIGKWKIRQKQNTNNTTI